MVVYGILLLLSLLKIVVGDDRFLLNPGKSCLPTSTQVGFCHVCVCKTDGVYYCRDSECGIFKNITDTGPNSKECEPYHVYRQDILFCSCDASGHWKSLDCQRRFLRMRPRTSPYAIQIGTNIACTPGHFYVTDCNICVCGDSGYIHFDSCTHRRCLRKSKIDKCNPGDFLRTTKELCACSDINYFIDRLCLPLGDHAIQRVNADDLDRIIDFGQHWENLKIHCKPFYTYKNDCSKCTCDIREKLKCDGVRCERPLQSTNEELSLRLRTFNQFESLPELKGPNDKSNTTNHHGSLPEIRDGETCVPGRLYKLECNTCRCTADRSLMCTKMACIDWKNQNKMNAGKKALRDGDEQPMFHLPRVQKGVLCKPGKLYKSKCRRCFCTNKNKLVCSKKPKDACIFDKFGNPAPIKTPEDVHPVVKSADLMGLSTLVSESEMCKPGQSYKVDCNFCVCLESGNILCQKKLCVSYEDMTSMDAKKMSGKPCNNFGETTMENCKSCDCVDGKTNCQVIPGCSQDKLQLAGPAGRPYVDLESETDKGKCVPNAIYKANCNKCYCQTNGALRCTQKTCLNYSQVKLMEKQRAYLEKHGL